MSSLQKTSKLITLILRHKPEIIGITLDEHGWANFRDLFDGVDVFGSHHLDMEDLCEIVRTDEKQRYSLIGMRSLQRNIGIALSATQ